MKFLALSNILELKQEVDILSLTVSTFMTLVADNLFLWKMQPRGEEIHYRLLRKKGLDTHLFRGWQVIPHKIKR